MIGLGELALRGVELAPRILEELLKRSEDSCAGTRGQLAPALGKLTRVTALARMLKRPLSACSGTQIRSVRKHAEGSIARVSGAV